MDWSTVKTRVQAQWHKLTDDDLEHIDGQRDRLISRIQERHGLHRDEAESQINEWHDRNPTSFFERY
jgi:uncharacterized protein YjbJ (UPF0337 family)